MVINVLLSFGNKCVKKALSLAASHQRRYIIVDCLQLQCNKNRREYSHDEINGADYEARTRYLHLGKVALYQMS